METRASYIAVAAFVLVLLAGGIGFVLWTAGTADRGPAYILHHVRLAGSVAGLGVGSPVLFGGIPIGSVTDIRLDPRDPSLTRVEMSVRADVPIRTDSEAVLESKSLIGGVVVEISRGGRTSPRLTAAEIPAGRSSWERLVTAAPKLMDKGRALVDRLDLFLDPANGAAAVRILASLERLSAEMERQKAALDRVLAHGRATGTRLGQAWDRISAELAEIRANGLRLGHDGEQAVAELERAGRAFGETRDGLDRLVAENGRGIRDFESSGYPQLPALMAELKLVMRNYTRLWNEIRRDPGAFLLDNGDSGYQPQ